jgi:hypothetical protein
MDSIRLKPVGGLFQLLPPHATPAWGSLDHHRAFPSLGVETGDLRSHAGGTRESPFVVTVLHGLAH